MFKTSSNVSGPGKVKVTQSCPTLCDPIDYIVHGIHQNIGVGSLSLLQGIFPTQGSNPGLPHCRWILYQLSHKRSPRILEWTAYPFSSGSSQPREASTQNSTSRPEKHFITRSTALVTPLSFQMFYCKFLQEDLEGIITMMLIMVSSPTTSWQIAGGKMEIVSDFIFLASKIIVDSDCRHEIKRCFLLGRKAITNLESI